MVDDDRLPLRPGESAGDAQVRFRTLGCYPLTGAIKSAAATVAEIVAELRAARTSERQGRLIDTTKPPRWSARRTRGLFLMPDDRDPAAACRVQPRGTARCCGF